MNHLYIQTAFLGDLLLAIPTLKQIRYWDPKSHLTVLCRKGYGSLLEDLSLCDVALELDKQNKSLAAQHFKNKSYDVIFCPHQSTTSQKLAGQISAKDKVGYKTLANTFTFNKRVRRHLDWPEAMRQLQLLGAVDDSVALKLEAFSHKTQTIPPWSEMKLQNLSWSEFEVQQLAIKKMVGFKTHEPFVCIAPGSVWPTKRWLPEKFVKVAIELVRKGMQIVVMGAPEERQLCEKVKMEIPNSYCVAGNLSILESLKILSKAKGLICNDSGAMHMASLFSLPTIALFGPTVQELGYKPWNPKAVVCEVDNLLCRPCGQHGTKVCPIGTHRCMRDIDPMQVAEKASVLFV